jgi:hypothetical protein
MIKILTVMALNLMMFLALWAMILILFMCVGMLLFSELKYFKTIDSTLSFLVYAAIGAWDLTVFTEKTYTTCIIEEADIMKRDSE